MSAASAELRPMRPDDLPAAYAASRSVLFSLPAGLTEESLRARQEVRMRHLLETDPGGAWVAEGDGDVVGLSMALLRERLWGLSLFAVREEAQGRGIGRRLLEAALAYGRDRASGWVVVSTERPAAMRRYALAGLDLHPCVSAAGIADRSRIPDVAARVEDAGEGGIPTADALGRAVRRAGHARDLPRTLQSGARLLLFEDRAFAVLQPHGAVQLLAARDPEAAQAVLWGAFAATPAGATSSVDFITAGQRWAIPVLLQAGLALSPDGPVFLRGDVGPFAPYVPSAAYL